MKKGRAVEIIEYLARISGDVEWWWNRVPKYLKKCILEDIEEMIKDKNTEK